MNKSRRPPLSRDRKVVIFSACILRLLLAYLPTILLYHEIRMPQQKTNKRQELQASQTVTRGSKNVFRDLNLPGADELLVKGDLAIAIARIIQKQNLTQTNAATLLWIDQPKVSKIVRGDLTEFSMGRLMHLLTKLGRDIEIRVKKVREERNGHITVSADL